MHFGDVVTILKDGIRISEEELSPIGITHGSTSWGAWLPDLRYLSDPAGRDERPPHLILSPFAISAWPALVRVELRLNDRRGAMTAATEVLKANGLNILTIDGTPTGHHHATLNLIGEAMPKRMPGKSSVFSDAEEWTAADRHFANADIWKYCCKQLAPEMLRYALNLKNEILKENEARRAKSKASHGFLRDTFADSTRSHRGVLYGHSDLPEDISAVGEAEGPVAVKCTWLQEMAFFWLYRADREQAMQFTYNRKLARLSLAAEKETFSTHTRSFSPPFKSVAAISAFSQYLRVALSDADRWSRTVAVTIPFQAELNEDRPTSMGLQHEICKLLDDRYSLRKVSISTKELSHEKEHGELTLLLSRTNSAEIDDTSMQDILARVNRASNAIGPHILLQPPPTIRRLASRRVFMSTRYSWLSQTERQYAVISNLFAFHGFELVDAREPNAVQGFAIIPGENISETAVRLIQHCDAVLQIIPIKGSDDLQWLLFESGAARGLKRPTVVCVECSESKRTGEVGLTYWQNALRPAHGTRMLAFYSQATMESTSVVVDYSDFPTLEQVLNSALALLQTVFYRGNTLGETPQII